MARRFWLAAALLLAGMAALQVASLRDEAQTWDEATHLAAGHSYWVTGDFRLNAEHPPLGKLLCALPVLAWPALLDHPAWLRRDQIEYGRAFLYGPERERPADAILFRARCVTIALTICLGALVAWWTRRQFGAAVALLALTFFCLDPNIVAHGRYVTTDLIAALFFFAACVTWGLHLETRHRRHLLLAGIAFGLALASKFSLLLLVPLLPALALLRHAQEQANWRTLPRRVLQPTLALYAIGLLVLALIYARETLRPWRPDRAGPAPAGEASDLLLRRPLATVVDQRTWIGQTLHAAGTTLRVPAYSYLVGLNSLAVHNHDGQPSYLLGNVSSSGRWLYFPVAFLVKTPTALLLALAAAVALACYRSPRWRAIPLPWLVLLVPPLAYLAASMASHLNLGLRHLLPVHPFLHIIAARGTAHLGCAVARPTRAVLLLMLLLAAETLAAFPHYLAFFNWPSGGIHHGDAYLVDSNLDWGQDAIRLKRYMDEHGLPSVCVAYFGNADFAYYRIGEQHLPTTSQTAERARTNCVAALSATLRQDVYVPSGSYQWLRERRPMGKVGASIYLYDLRQ